MRLYNRKEETKHGQKTVTGRLLTSKQFRLLNVKNIGESPLNPRYDKKNEGINVAAGTWVDYEMNETHTGNYHTIYETRMGIRYSKTLKTKD